MKHRSIAPMRTAKYGYIIVSLALCLLGVVLIVAPEFSASALGYIFGTLLLVFGAIKLTGYFSKDLYRLAFQNDLTFGILLMILGIVLFVHPGSLISFLCISLGIIILADGLLKAQIALEAKSFGLHHWWVILIFAVLTAILGLVLLFRPGEGTALIMTLLGITLISEGLLNLSTAITAVKIIKYQKPDIIDME